MGAYVALRTSAICSFLLPIAYLGWLVLNNREDYLGADRPRGTRAIVYNAVRMHSTMTVLASVCYSTAVALDLF
ncbi:MAG: hypothetical protein ACK5HY_14060 [Parahaliea sp.]